jgi:hypothetical protein
MSYSSTSTHMIEWIEFLTPYLNKKDNRIWGILLQNTQFPICLVEYYMNDIQAYEKEQVQKYGQHIALPYIWGIWGLSSNTTLTPNFIHKYHHKLDWGEMGLSRNPAMTPDLIDMYLAEKKPFDWKWNGLSRNPSITLEFIHRHLDKPWCWGKGGLSQHPSITPEFVEEFIEELPWEWGNEGLSSNPSITPEFIEKHIYRPWAFSIYMPNGIHEPDYELMKFHNISIPDAMNESEIVADDSCISKTGYDKYAIGYDMDEYIDPDIKNEPFGLSYYMKHPDCFKPEWIERMETMYGIVWDWSYTGFSSNPSITLEFFKYFIQPCHMKMKRWNFGIDGLSSNPAFTPMCFNELIQIQPTKLGKLEIGMFGLSTNSSFHSHFIDALITIYEKVKNETIRLQEPIPISHEMYSKKYSIPYIHENGSISSISMSLLHIRLLVESFEWNWSGLSSNPSITVDFLKKYNTKRWTWGADGLSSNKGVNYKIIQEFKDKHWAKIQNIPLGSVFMNPSLFTSP